jgi:gluconokinase
MSVTIVLMGVSGSGKSTVMRCLIDRLAWRSAEGDDFHSESNVAKMTAGQPLSDADRWTWLQAIAGWIGQCEADDVNAIVTCSALRRAYRDVLAARHASIVFVHLCVDRRILQDRLQRREGHFMPASLLQSQLETLEPLQDDEPGFEVCGERAPSEIVDDIVRRLPHWVVSSS